MLFENGLWAVSVLESYGSDYSFCYQEVLLNFHIFYHLETKFISELYAMVVKLKFCAGLPKFPFFEMYLT